MSDALLDTLRNVETPEGIELKLAVAGPVVRALAWGIDSLIRIGIYAGLAVIMLSAIPGGLGIGLYFIAVFVVGWFYFVVFEVYRDGATPGKSAMNLRVLHDDATPVGWSASMVRNLLRFVDFLPILYGFGLISMLLSRDFKRLGDVVAGTVVVYKDNARGGSAPPAAAPVAPNYPLSLEEQQALVSFAERSTQLTEERNQELAELTGPLTGGQDPGQTLAQVFGIANWIAGRR